ncbi:6PGD-domain-containing protein [Trichoderma longibrachiatum ATCC 18648]|uniref:6-phosphogluconate dehydrogenase, decarboxylating n=1 Tax=Trichoderma longibrachiatum ATCC 18648 TaxID=983965 RepID=A0A2T4BPL9_TRILO|nr:6PGD-domain-containing protein [Trichoderma longibrachiatum ATCC 18648]
MTMQLPLPQSAARPARFSSPAGDPKHEETKKYLNLARPAKKGAAGKPFNVDGTSCHGWAMDPPFRPPVFPLAFDPTTPPRKSPAHYLWMTSIPALRRRHRGLFVLELAAKKIRFVGSGVSGGEEGARYGPSLMPGGNEEAWPYIKDIFQAIAAKSDGEACCEWVGDEGAGHYVKMVHNGIEYGDMQLICEAYDIMKRGLGLSSKEIGDVFAKWNKGVLDSFLIEITRDILYFNDDDGTPLVDKILDKAGQKGTGKWTAINALDLGMPVTLIAEAVLARCLSSIKDERTLASTKLRYVARGSGKFEGNKEQFLEDLEQALYASKIISYAQGFMLMQEAARDFGWKLNKPSIALMWRGGCIIRSVFLKDITSAYRNEPDLKNLLFDNFFNDAIHKAQPGWRAVVAQAAELGIPTPAFSTALSWFDGYRTKDLPANLLQAQRDYFGAHTFHIKPEHASDKYPEGKDIHVNWTGRGGNVSASTYQA